jgi:hypothetical protein
VRGHASTGPGRPSVLPSGRYSSPEPVRPGEAGAEVTFTGDDGRRRIFDTAELALPGWRVPVAAAFAARTGISGGLRTLASAESTWQATRRFVSFLSLRQPPPWPGDLTAAHLDAFHAEKSRTMSKRGALAELRRVLILLEQAPLKAVLAPDVIEYLGRRWPDPRADGAPGYSDGELARIVAAARSDAVAIIARIEAGEQLAARYREALAALSPAEEPRARELAEMAETGLVPCPDGVLPEVLRWRVKTAEHLFLTLRDVVPLMVLAVALTGRNVETLKELPVQHRLLEDKAVEVTVVKRRRGAGRWHDQATWEIGSPSRRLHTPGGFYLLLCRLTESSRAFSGSKTVWSVWRNGHRAGVADTTAEHWDPFSAKLRTQLGLCGWAARHDLRGDNGCLLKLDMNRLRTSVEVRRTKQMGGHLPSAARTNTMQTLWSSYLRGDPAVTEWADDILGDAFADAERAALDAHYRALAPHSGALRLSLGQSPVCPRPARQAGADEGTARKAVPDALDTGWTACTDPEHGPWNEGRCAVSFLDCFHCGNCVITHDHLPRLLSLLDAMEQRRQEIPLPAWWRRYGPAWAAIRHQVLPEFSPAEITAAEITKPHDTLLDLVEGLREDS